MNDPRAGDHLNASMSGDLRALGDASSRDVPAMGSSLTLARALRRRTAHQRLTSGALATVGAIGFLIVPISYQRITAHDVELLVSGPMAPSLVNVVTTEFQDVLGASGVAVTPLPGMGEETVRFASRIPARGGVNIEAAARSLASALERNGHTAHATVVPRRERVSGSVYALARDHVIRIRGRGRRPLDVETELRRRLEEEGVPDARVSVTDEGGMRRIQVETPNHGASAPTTLGIGLGAAMDSADGNPTQVEVKRIPTEVDGMIYHVEVTWQGRRVAVDVPHSEAMSDVALAREVESRLRAAGFDGTARVTRGALQIELKR